MAAGSFYLDRVIAALTSLLTALGPAAVILVMAVVFAETGLMVGFFLPGDTLLFATGVLVATGVLSLPLWVVILGVFVAAAAGDQVGYVIGRMIGPQLFSRPRSRVLRPEHAERAEAFFATHGPKAVLLARFVAMARTFTPVVAGVARMPRRTFTAYNLGGAAVWSAALLTAGFFLGGVPLIAAHVELVVLGLVALSVLPAGAAALHAHRSGRRPAPTPPRTPARELELV